VDCVAGVNDAKSSCGIGCVFDLMVLEGVDPRREPLSRRRELLEQKILPKVKEPIKYSAVLDADLPDLIQ
jgi:ATP-dependent DNA ligase